MLADFLSSGIHAEDVTLKWYRHRVVGTGETKGFILLIDGKKYFLTEEQGQSLVNGIGEALEPVT